MAGYGVGAIEDLKKTALNINIEKDKREFEPNKENKKIYQNFCNLYGDIFNNSLNETFHLLSNLQ